MRVPFEANADVLDAMRRPRLPDHRPGFGRAAAGRDPGRQRPGIGRRPRGGSHAGEHAGIRAAVELAERLDTDRRLDVFPARDPVGLDGYAAALGTALGEPPDLPATSHAVGEEHLERLALDDPGALVPLRGRRVYLPPGLPDVEGTGTLGRAHTVIVSPDGAVRHLNRFHDSDWAAAEPRSFRRLLAETDPGLFVDLHESVSNGERFHVTLRRTGDPGSEERAERVEQTVAAVQAMVEEYEDALGA